MHLGKVSCSPNMSISRVYKYILMPIRLVWYMIEGLPLVTLPLQEVIL